MKEIIEPQLEPQITPFKCPVCNGFGTVSFKKISCHACRGRGFVIINSIDRETYEQREK